MICRDCLEKIRPASEGQCRVCGKFLPAGNDTCGACLLAPPPFLRHVSYAAYEGTLREVIILYKYGEVEPLKYPLARPLPGDHRRQARPRLSTPWSRSRPICAGGTAFSPCGPWAGSWPAASRSDFWPRVLLKKKHTPPQVGLSQAQRKANLDGAFALAPGKRVAGRNVLLIDDVTTTGTTIARCAAVLKRSGARVTALTLAQTRF